MIARFAVLLVALSVLMDLAGRTALCFDPARPFVPESLPLCILFSFGILIKDLNDGGLRDLLWHYLPTIVVSLSIAIAWTLKDRRRRPT